MLPFEQTKLGNDAKGPKAYVVQQTHCGYIAISMGFLLLIVGALVIDYRYERFQFSLHQEKLFKIKEHQRVNKLSAEAKLMKISAVLQTHLRAEKKEESSLRVMQSRAEEFQRAGRVKIIAAIDEAAEKQTDINEVKKEVLALYDGVMGNVKKVVDTHLMVTHKQAENAKRTMAHIQQDIIQELKQEIRDDARDIIDDKTSVPHGMGHGAPPPAGSPRSPDVDSLSEEDQKRWQEAENSLNHMLEHLQSKVTAMGGVRMTEEKIKQWEKVLEDTNSGKLTYEDAEKLMSQLMAEPTHGPMKSIIDESLPILDNFEMLLEEIKFLPQKQAMLHELAKWKQQERTVHEVLLYIEEKMGTGDLDPEWLVEAAGNSNEDYEAARRAGIWEGSQQ